jgi:hypothetical protein
MIAYYHARVISCLAVFLSALPIAARADIYSWTDAQGNTVISDVRPDADAKQAANVRVVAKVDAKTAAAAALPVQTMTPMEEALLDRVRVLESQLQDRRYPPAAAVPPYYGDNSVPPPPPDYYGYDYYSNTYPAFTYSYPLAGFYSYAARPGTAFRTHRSSAYSHAGSLHGSVRGGNAHGAGRR